MVLRHRQYNTVEAVDVKHLTIVIPICVYIQRVVYLSQIASTTVTTTPRVHFSQQHLRGHTLRWEKE